MASEDAEVRLYQLRAAVEATERCFGPEATSAVTASVAPGLRSVLDSVATSMSWTPVRHMIDWSLAVWDGPAAHDRAAMVEYTQRQVDAGFGRIRRALLAVATPRLLLERAPDLWEKDNRGGHVRVDIGDHRASWTLVEHPYCDVPHARAAMAEVIRYCVELTRARDVTESHGLSGGAFEVTVRWR